jgi:hypothetical protein
MRAKRTVTIPPPIAILLELLVAHAIEPEAALKLISLGLRGRVRFDEIYSAAEPMRVEEGKQSAAPHSFVGPAPPNPACPIKGNVNRKGERIYHEPGGRDYERVVMDLTKGKRWFCSASEAEAAGWRRAQH